MNERIRAIQPTTFAELGVWAKATRFDSMPRDHFDTAWDDIGDIDDWRFECLSRLLFTIERLAKATPLGQSS